MEYRYCKHIVIRMKERKITAEMLEAILSNSVDVRVVPSKSDKDVELILGIIHNFGIVVVLNKVTKILITVRHMRKEEKRLFFREGSE